MLAMCEVESQGARVPLLVAHTTDRVTYSGLEYPCRCLDDYPGFPH